MTDKVLSEFKRKIESFELVPDTGGCFEVSVGDNLVYSKLQTGEFPDEEQLVQKIGQLIG